MYILDGGLAVVNFLSGIYLPLMAANSVVALQCEKFAVKGMPFSAFTTRWRLASGIGRAILSASCAAASPARWRAGLLTLRRFRRLRCRSAALLSSVFGRHTKWFISAFLSEYSHDMPFKIKKAERRPQRVEERRRVPFYSRKAVTPAAIKAKVRYGKAVIIDIRRAGKFATFYTTACPRHVYCRGLL